MNTHEHQNDIAALDELLDAEREALLHGDLEVLGSIASSKENLITTLSVADGKSLEDIEQVSKKLERNQLLIDGALEGIRAVTTRLANVRAQRGTLDTYDASGQKKQVSIVVDNSVERRA